MNATTIENSTATRQRYALTQFGVMSIIGMIPIGDDRSLQRGDWIVCRTGRGLELGLVRSTGSIAVNNRSESDESPSFVGQLIRMATDSDHMANSRLTSDKLQGLEACSEWLVSEGKSEILLDVDITLDGQRLYFHFLGQDQDFDPAMNDRLVEIYDQVTGIKRFTDAVTEGCGPNCGSDGTGCQTGGSCGTKSRGTSSDQGQSSGCSGCALKGGCHK